MYFDIFICADMKSPQPKKFLAVERPKTSTAKKNLWLWKFENLHSQKYFLAVETWNPKMAVELVRTQVHNTVTV